MCLPTANPGKSTERIDGIVAIIMALGRAMLPGDAPPSYQVLILGPP
jgi:hypothetical protein